MSSIPKYYKPIHPSLPNPSGHLSSTIPAKAIAGANAQVGEQAETGTDGKRKKRGTYNKYTPKDRAEIARYAKIHGVQAAKRVFSKKLDTSINDCTIKRFKKAYDEEFDFKRSCHGGGTTSPVKELHTFSRGRPVILGENLDLMVQQYLLAIRARGGTISTSVVLSAATGIVTSIQKKRLVEYGVQ